MQVEIKANKQSSDYYIAIDCYYEGIREITEATEIEQQADFEDLIENIGYIFLKYKFEVVEHHWSNKSPDSYYYSFYVRDREGRLRTEVLIHLRIAMHETAKKRDEDYFNNAKGYYTGLAEKYKADEEIPDMLFKNIIIGANSFTTVGNALQYMKKVLNELREPEVNMQEVLDAAKMDKGY